MGSHKVNDTDRLIGRNMRRVRKARKLALPAIANNTTPSRSGTQISKYELGTNRIPASLLYEVAQILNVNVGVFFVRDEAWPDKPDLAEVQEMDRVQAELNLLWAENNIKKAEGCNG